MFIAFIEPEPGASPGPIETGGSIMHAIRTALLALLTSLAFAVAAQTPLTLIYPAPPGGGGDQYFRILAQVMPAFYGAPVLVTNMSGGGGSIGVQKMVTSEPDGNTVAGVWTGPVLIAPHTLGVPYKPTDYTPVMLFSSTPYVLCVKPDFPANTGPELIDLVKKNPNKYSFGTDGPGGLAQLAATRVFLAHGTTQRDVPYKGAGETTVALLGGHIDIYVGSIPPILQHVQAGRAKCLIVTSAKRASMLPNASGLGDLGIPGEETLLWRAVLAPRNTPPAQIARLENAFEQAAKSPESLKFLEGVGETLEIMKGTELRDRLLREYDAYGRVIQAAGMAKKN